MNTPVNLGAHLSCPFLRDPVYWWPRHEVWQGAADLQKHSAPRTLLWQVQAHGVRYLSWRETQKDMSNLPVYSQLFLPSHQSCQAHGILASSRLAGHYHFSIVFTFYWEITVSGQPFVWFSWGPRGTFVKPTFVPMSQDLPGAHAHEKSFLKANIKPLEPETEIRCKSLALPEVRTYWFYFILLYFILLWAFSN